MMLDFRTMLLLLWLTCWLSIDLTMSRTLTVDDWGRLAGPNDLDGTDIPCVESSSCRGRAFGSRSEDVAEFGNVPPCRFHGWIRCIEQSTGSRHKWSDPTGDGKYYSYQHGSHQPEMLDYRSSSTVSIPQSHYGYAQYQPRKVTEPTRFVSSIQHPPADPSRLVKQESHHSQQFAHQSFQQTPQRPHQVEQSVVHVRDNHIRPTAGPSWIPIQPAQQRVEHPWQQPGQQESSRFSQSQQSQQFRQSAKPAQPETFKPAQQSSSRMGGQQPIAMDSRRFNQQSTESQQRQGNFHPPVQQQFQPNFQQQIMDSHRLGQQSQRPPQGKPESRQLVQLSSTEAPRLSQVSQFQQGQGMEPQLISWTTETARAIEPQRLVQVTEQSVEFQQSPFDTRQSIETVQRRPEPRRLKEPDVQQKSIEPVIEPAKSSLESFFQFQSIDTQQQLAALIRSLALAASQPNSNGLDGQLTANSAPFESNIVPFIPFSDPLPLEPVSNNFLA